MVYAHIYLYIHIFIWVGVTNIDEVLTNMNKYWILNNLYELVYPMGIININYIDALSMPHARQTALSVLPTWLLT